MKRRTWALSFFLLIVGVCHVLGQPPVISYNPSSATYTFSPPILPLSPLNTGGIVPATAYGGVTVLNVPIVPPPVNPPNIAYQTPKKYPVGAIIPILSPVNSGGAVPARIYGEVTTFAGNGTHGNTDGLGTAASFNGITDLAIDAAQNVYVVDAANNNIRKITPAGQVSVLAGSGAFTSLDGTGTAASFINPYGLAFDNTGDLLVAENGAHKIRKVTPAGVVTTVAGDGTMGTANGPALSATFNYPNDITVNAAGDIFVADANGQIRKISGGIVSDYLGGILQGLVDGTGTTTRFAPASIMTDAQDNLLVGDGGNNVVRKITPAGVASTLIGSSAQGFKDGPASTASFNFVYSVATDGIGNLFITDMVNSTIRQVNPEGIVTTLAGIPNQRTYVDGKPDVATFMLPNGIVADNSGNLYVADAGNAVIRKINITGYTIDKPLPAGLTFDSATGTITGTPTTVTAADDYTITAYNGVGRSVTKLNIEVVAAPIITYPTPLVYSANVTITPVSPTNTGGAVLIAGYSIDKTLPAGLTFDINTGVISGTPTTVTAATDYTVTATNSGGSSSFKINIEVKAVLLPSIITFPLIPQNSIDANNNLTPSATSTNNETPIIYSSDNPLVAIITANGLIHLVGPGVAHITASQAGNNHYNAATPVMQTLTVIEYQHLLFPPIAVKTTCAADFPLNVTSTSSSTIPIIYTSSNPNVASVSANGTVHIMSAGTTTITANQAGSPLYDPAEPQTQILTVIAPVMPALAVTPGTYSSCLGLPVTYTATATNPGTNPVYQWLVNSVKMPGQNGTAFTSSTLQTNDVITCTLTSTDICGVTTTVTSNTASIIADPYITPTIAIQANTTMPVCVGTAISFTATATNQGTSPSYQWQVNGTNAGTNQATFTSTALNNGDRVTCVLTLQNGKCVTALVALSNVIVAQITPNQNPAIIVTTPVTTVFGGTPVTFTATTNAGTGAVYQWQVNGVNTGTNSSIFTTSTLQNGDAVTCMVSGGAGCITPVTSLPLIMTVNSPTTIPIVNTFTPNGDGINDVWNITALAFFPDCLVNVYNRFGALVFQSKGYSQPWDGVLNGKTVPVGTYYYVIDLGVTQPKLSGSVTILR